MKLPRLRRLSSARAQDSLPRSSEAQTRPSLLLRIDLKLTLAAWAVIEFFWRFNPKRRSNFRGTDISDQFTGGSESLWGLGMILDDAIIMAQEAIDASPEPNAERLSRLGNYLNRRYDLRGELDDLERAIAAEERALALTPDGHPQKAAFLNNLGCSMFDRYSFLGDVDDLKSAIRLQELALDLVSDESDYKPRWLDNLGFSRQVRFNLYNNLDDLEVAIALRHRAVELIADDHPTRPSVLSHLGESLLARYNDLENIQDLENAIIVQRRAVDLTRDGNPDTPIWLAYLGKALQARFERFGDVNDLEDALQALRSSVDLTPNDHADKAIRRDFLGRCLVVRYRMDKTETSFNEALSCFMEATEQPLGSSEWRFPPAESALRLLVQNPQFSTPEALLLAHSRLLGMLPELVWLGYGIERRLAETQYFRKLVTSAVSAAISADALQLAVEWLEAGRSLVWSQLLSLRSPIDELQEQYPELAKSLRDTQQQLQKSVNTSFVPESRAFEGIEGVTVNPRADRHRRLAVDYDTILKTIRGHAGFEDFLRPRRFSGLGLSPVLAHGPVVFLSVDDDRCDALAALPGGGITLIPLPKLSSERAHQLQSLWLRRLKGLSVRMQGVGTLDALTGSGYGPLQLSVQSDTRSPRHSSLVEDDDSLDQLPEYMWKWIVGPVLAALGFLTVDTGSKLPHITWCPTGPLTQLPLHAAGLYNVPDGPRAFNLIVSSYTPSLAALQRSYEGIARHTPAPQMLVVTQPAALGHTRLPNTIVEGMRVKDILQDAHISSKLLNHDQATVSAVRDVLDQYPWLHLACHGSQHPRDATRSAFALYDGPLSLSDLMRTVADDAELAFLSACQTAAGDASNPEESVHLAAGMLAVGFKGVVATMWSIMDQDAPVVVEAYYKKLIELRNTGVIEQGETGAAYALHEAVAQLRAKVGERNFGRWVPFVHFGV
ncbi:unnamed protein product [Peniophora sp. CBMAI 1063]|nr:unnamed protein product [Peniophora sp. CBMAI 1063]